LYALLHQT